MKIKIISALLVFCSVLIISAQAFAMQPSNKDDQKAWLFVLSAPTATLTQLPTGYQLQMTHIHHVLGFTDRPFRDSKEIPLEEFMHTWSTGKDSFSADHPNGVIVAELESASDGKHQHIQERTLMLSHPSYDASSQRLTFTITSLDSKSALHPGKLYDVSLFLDDLIDGGL